MPGTQTKPPETQGAEWTGSALPSQADIAVWQQGLHPHATLPLIVFDMDGTLLDSYEMALRSHARAIEALGLPPVPHNVLESLNGPNVEQVCSILGLPMERKGELQAAIIRADFEFAPMLMKLFPGVLEMLAALEGQASLCLLTNGSTEIMELLCETSGIGKSFVARSAYTPGVTKAMRIREWMQERGMPRTLVVGDRATDVDAGREAGAYTLGVTYGIGRADEVAHADALADTIAEVWRHCERFCAGAV